MDYRKAKQLIDSASADSKVKYAMRMLLDDNIVKKNQMDEMVASMNMMIDIVSQVAHVTHGVYLDRAKQLMERVGKKESTITDEQMGDAEP